MHLDLVQAIAEGDADRAEAIMHEHVKAFYDEVHQTLEARD
jgi:DNA-binding GntR family transcriptional regulator